MATVRIKICGVTRWQDAQRIVELGADALGLNFYRGSPRSVGDDVAAGILDALSGSIVVSGIFVNESCDSMRRILQALPRITVAQWHGDGRPPIEKEFQLVPAFGVTGRESLSQIRAYLDECRGQDALPAGVMVDAKSPDAYGGSGRTAPWEQLAEFAMEVPLILAGGLTPTNVGEAIRIVRPYAVDTASGVETVAGVKDANKIERFIDAAREAGEQIQSRDTVGRPGPYERLIL